LASDTDVPAAIPKDNRPKRVAELETDLQAANNRIRNLQRQLEAQESLRTRLTNLEHELDELVRSWEEEREQLLNQLQEEQQLQLQQAQCVWREELVLIQSERDALKLERDNALERLNVLRQQVQEQLKAGEEEYSRLADKFQREAEERSRQQSCPRCQQLERLQAERQSQPPASPDAFQQQLEREYRKIVFSNDRLQREIVILAAEYEAVKEQAAVYQEEIDRMEQDREQKMQAWLVRLQKEHEEQVRLAENRFEKMQKLQEGEADSLRRELEEARRQLDASFQLQESPG
jgi:hypothetical protein